MSTDKPRAAPSGPSLLEGPQEQTHDVLRELIARLQAEPGLRCNYIDLLKKLDSPPEQPRAQRLCQPFPQFPRRSHDYH